MKFTIHEKQVKAHEGAAYDLSRYTEGVDYKRQKTGFGSRVMFREGFAGLEANKAPGRPKRTIVMTVVDPSLVEHKQNKPPIVVVLDEEEPVITRPSELDGAVRAAKVVKKYANQRYVETDTLGRVFVGEKGAQIRVGQIINVKNGELYLR